MGASQYQRVSQQGLMTEKKALLSVSNLKKYFVSKGGLRLSREQYIRAVDDISFHILEGETFGLAGESGCGKTTTGRCIVGLEVPTAGEIYFGGKSVAGADKGYPPELRKEMQMIFQDPFASLNPRMKVGEAIAEPMAVHNLARGKEREERVAELMSLVGLEPKAKDQYPHQFSGGQRQRVGISRALASAPSLIIADEPVSSLDVSVQAQVLNLLMELQERRGLTYLLISHDLRVLAHISDRIGVMYGGRLVELAESSDILAHPLHSYTRALFSSVPDVDPGAGGERSLLRGEPPSLLGTPSGCRFSSRCSMAEEKCFHQPPLWQEAEPGHMVSCHKVIE